MHNYSIQIFMLHSLPYIFACYLLLLVKYSSPRRCWCLISPYRVSLVGIKCLSFLHYSPLSYVLVDGYLFQFPPQVCIGMGITPLSYVLVGLSLV